MRKEQIKPDWSSHKLPIGFLKTQVAATFSSPLFWFCSFATCSCGNWHIIGIVFNNVSVTIMYIYIEYYNLCSLFFFSNNCFHFHFIHIIYLAENENFLATHFSQIYCIAYVNTVISYSMTYIHPCKIQIYSFKMAIIFLSIFNFFFISMRSWEN